jgi:hypothetical protein
LTPARSVWARIVSELADLQDAAPSGRPGAVVNPICNRPYVVDTCCAASVFAAEHRRTADPRWRERADAALAAARSEGPFSGVHEPVWAAGSWRDVPGSLPATAIAVDAYIQALGRLDLDLDDDAARDLLGLLARCRTRRGGYVHDAPATEARVEVQNATASALDLLHRVPAGDRGAPDDVAATVARLRRGQRSSGFWPYRYPGTRAKKVLDVPLRIVFRPRKFFFYRGSGDFMHHTLTLYYAAGYASSSPASAGTSMIASAWGWIVERLVEEGDGVMSIDWVGDPVPTSPQAVNARDTNAYFLILGTLPRLVALGIVDRAKARSVTDGLLAHVEADLSSPAGGVPCVKPHEGPAGIVRNILPMFEQSVAWKGRLMADLVTS